MSVRILIATTEDTFPINRWNHWPMEVQRASTEDILHFLSQEWEPHIIIIDLNKFPIELISQIRRQSEDPTLGIIACGKKLTQKQEISCFNHGADHLLPSFHPVWQMDCRINALMKRRQDWREGYMDPKNNENHSLSFYEIHLDSKNHVVTVAGQVINTTPTQLRLLQAFMSYPDCLLTRSWLKQTVWSHLKISTRSIDAHISKLKKVFPLLDTHLFSVYGKGYRLSHEKTKTKAA